jgi:hypothetical protein
MWSIDLISESPGVLPTRTISEVELLFFATPEQDTANMIQAGNKLTARYKMIFFIVSAFLRFLVLLFSSLFPFERSIVAAFRLVIQL